MHKFKMKAHSVVFLSHLIFFSAFDPSTRPGLCMEAFSTDTGLSQPMPGLLLLTAVGLFTCHLPTGASKV